MKPLKKSTGILATAILIVMISGLLLANQMIDYLENNITTDYTKVYHDDLDRLPHPVSAPGGCGPAAGRGVDGVGKRERLYGHAL